MRLPSDARPSALQLPGREFPGIGPGQRWSLNLLPGIYTILDQLRAVIELVHSGVSRFLQLQPEPGVDVSVDLGQGLGGGAVGTFLTTLVVGAILVAVVPEYTERMMASLVEDPVGSTGYGLLCLGGLVALILLLVFSIIGILAVVPLILVALVIWAIGAAIAFLAIAERLVGHDDGWVKPLVVAAAMNGALALTGVGGIVAFVVGAAGFGAVVRSLPD